MNVVFYGRYSDAGQSEQSIEGQRKVCYEFAEHNDYNIIAEYIDRATTGTEAENRHEFQRMIADSTKRQFQGVLVYQLDRFARNREDSVIYKSVLKKNGVRVLSARENITSDASGILLESVLEGLAEYFSAENSQKVIRGMALTAEKCEFTGSGVPLGYKIVDKKFALNEDEAPIVKRIFEMYLANKTMVEIIRYLNDNGVKTSKGNPFNKDSIRRILVNRKYLGIYIFKGKETPSGIPRIIDDSTFEQVQILLQKNKKAPARTKTVEENYLLTTKLFCGHCKAAMTGMSGKSSTGKVHQYYSCVTQRKRGDCNKKNVQKAYIENSVVDGVLSILTDDYIKDIAKKVSDLSAKENNTDTVKRLKKQLKENETAIANLIKAIETGKAVDVLSEQIEKRQAERSELEIQLAKEKMSRPVLTQDEVLFFLERFKSGNANDITFRTALIDTFVDRIYLYDGEEPRAEIYCNASDKHINCPINEHNSSSMEQLARRERLERPALCLEGRCSILLSYRRVSMKVLEDYICSLRKCQVRHFPCVIIHSRK